MSFDIIEDLSIANHRFAPPGATVTFLDGQTSGFIVVPLVNNNRYEHLAEMLQVRTAAGS